MRAVRVLPDVAGLDKLFDYEVPPGLGDDVRVGTRVRIDLHGRRVGGWVVADGVTPPPGVALRPLAKVTGWGPDPGLVELSGWAAWRWAGRRSALLTAASPDRAVRHLPAQVVRPTRAPDGSATVPGIPADGNTVVRIAPGSDRMPLIRSLLERGPALVVAPSASDAAALARRLRGEGEPVALLPDGWDRARAGGCTVIGARGAAWGPAPGVASMVVLDAHEEVHQEERAPTWHVRDVLGERARMAGVPAVAVSPCPDLVTLSWSQHTVVPNLFEERRGWPMGEAVDLREEDPANGLLTERLTALVRGHGRALLVLNRRGRARLLACHACGDLARCSACDAAVAQSGDGLICPRCGLARPSLCASCGGQRLKVLRPGVSRLRDQLEVLIGEPVGEVAAGTLDHPSRRVVIGTEAVLHQAGRAATVVFLDFDQELLAPRFRAAEQALALLARAGRLTGGRDRGGRVVVQTRVPRHDVVHALVHGTPAAVVDAERARREALKMPPCTALAEVSGSGSAAFVGAIDGVEILGPDDDRWLVRAPDHDQLCDALARAPRPPGRLRIEVDPLRI